MAERPAAGAPARAAVTLAAPSTITRVTASGEVTIGRFAELAERHWRTHLPAGYAEIADRPAFFAELETEAERQVFALEDAVAGPDVPGESFLEKVGRLQMARYTAEAQVVRELLLPEPSS